MAYEAPGRNHRKGISVIELAERFPDEDSAREWFEGIIWPIGRVCPRCGGTNTYKGTHKTMPYRCRPCNKTFSVRTSTVLESSRLPLKKWAWAIYLEITSLKGVSSMKLHRDIRVAQKNAWHMLHRIRETFTPVLAEMFDSEVEVDETFVGGKEGNKHSHKKLHAGRGGVGKAVVVGAKDRETGKIRAEVVEKTDSATLQGFVMDHVLFGTPLFTDEHKAYTGLEYVYDHGTVKHSVGEYVDEQIHVNGMESFWATLKRSINGTYHQMSKKHLQRYVNQFCAKHNLRDMDTMHQMEHVVAGMVGKRLLYKDLTAKTPAKVIT